MWLTRVLKWFNWKIARVFRRGTHCCRCPYRRFDYRLGICRVYFLYKGNASALRVSPWEECALVDLQQDIQVADMEVLHGMAEKIKEEQKEQEEEDGNGNEGSEESPTDEPSEA